MLAVAITAQCLQALTRPSAAAHSKQHTWPSPREAARDSRRIPRGGALQGLPPGSGAALGNGRELCGGPQRDVFGSPRVSEVGRVGPPRFAGPVEPERFGTADERPRDSPLSGRGQSARSDFQARTPTSASTSGGIADAWDEALARVLKTAAFGSKQEYIVLAGWLALNALASAEDPAQVAERQPPSCRRSLIVRNATSRPI